MMQALADAVLLLHFAVVVFVASGPVLIFAGNRRGWAWVNAPCYRIAHLGAIGVVVAQAWLGMLCPLTALESWLRRRAGGQVDEASFMQHWVQALIYYEAPMWVFALLYTAFAAVVGLVWWRYPMARPASAPGWPPGRDA